MKNVKTLLQWFYSSPIHETRKVRLLDVQQGYKMIVKNYGELNTNDTRFDDCLIEGFFYDSDNGVTYAFVKYPQV